MINNQSRLKGALEPRTEQEFQETVVQVNRVSKKTKGGNQIRFSVLVVVGDKKGRVGAGLGKAPDVVSGIKKAISFAKKRLITVPMRGTTIPYGVNVKFGAAQVLLKPAPPGSGVIAGGPVRAVFEAAGVHDVVAKMLGNTNKITNVYATIEGIRQLEKLSKIKQAQNETKRASKN